VSPTYAGAIKAFGTPQSCALGGFSSKTPKQKNFGRTVWRSLGVRAEFYTYGLTMGAGDACSAPSGVYLGTLWVTGPRWVTAKGLRIGDPIAKLQRLYPTALPHGDSFWLIIGKNVIGSTSLYPIFSATVANGRVTSFVFAIGAGGD
jgi:hypothetical protein